MTNKIVVIQYWKIQSKLNKKLFLCCWSLKNNISIYQMSKLTFLKHSTVKNYYNNCPLTRVDLDVISKFCYVLNCKIEDILEYKYPN